MDDGKRDQREDGVMIELRWLQKHPGGIKQNNDGTITGIPPVQVLQYRQEKGADLWSQWREVPVIIEPKEIKS